MRIKATIKKQLALYVVWTVLYLPVTAFGFWLHEVSPLKAAAIFARNVLLVGENFCSWPLWYLLASVVAFGLVYLMLRKGCSPLVVLVVSCGFLLSGYGMSVLMGLNDLPVWASRAVKGYVLVFGSARNGLFEGFFYVALGMFFGLRCDSVGNIKVRLLVLGCAVGYLGSVFVSADAHLPFCALFAACVFLAAVRKCGEGLGVHPFMRASSTVVYLVHMMLVVVVVYLVYGGTAAMPLDNGVPSFALFAVVYCCSLAIAALVYRASSRFPRVRWVFGI